MQEGDKWVLRIENLADELARKRIFFPKRAICRNIYRSIPRKPSHFNNPGGESSPYT